MNDQELFEHAELLADRTLAILRETAWADLKDLRRQIERAACSIPANIAEGIGRMLGREDQNPRAKLHFFRISFGSLVENLCHLDRLKAARPEAAESIEKLIGALKKFREELSNSIIGSPFASEQEREMDWIPVNPSGHPDCETIGRRCYVRSCGSCGAPEFMSRDYEGVRYFYFCWACGPGEREIVFPEDACIETVYRAREEEFLLYGKVES